jgi:hypothetical protein
MTTRTPTRGVGIFLIVAAPLALILIAYAAFTGLSRYGVAYYSAAPILGLGFGIWILIRIPKTRPRP